MGLMACATVIQLHCTHVFASPDINGTIAPPFVKTLMSVFLTHTIACHQPDASTPQVPIAASVLPSWGGPSMAELAMILMSASIQMFVTHKLRVSTFQEDSIAVVT